MFSDIEKLVEKNSVDSGISRSQLVTILAKVAPYLAYEFDIMSDLHVNMLFFYIWTENGKVFIES